MFGNTLDGWQARSRLLIALFSFPSSLSALSFVANMRFHISDHDLHQDRDQTLRVGSSEVRSLFLLRFSLAKLVA